MSENADGNFTPEQLAAYRQALQEEYEKSENPEAPNVKELEDLQPDFMAAIQHTVRHSNSESLKAKVAMWGIDKLIDMDRAKVDPLRNFLEGLTAEKDKDAKTRSS